MNYLKSDNKKKYLIGLGLGVCVSFLFICISAFLILLLKLDRAYCEVFSTVSVSAGAYVCAFSVSRKNGKKGYITGLIIGGIFFAVITAISLIVCKGKISSNTVFHFFIIVLSSLIGGITGVNKKGKTTV